MPKPPVAPSNPERERETRWDLRALPHEATSKGRT
uniref:Uncharacterized protein n=1 Tax=Arundo donax TaxID=35708 RepID=A0A0A9B5K1_ARUDO